MKRESQIWLFLLCLIFLVPLLIALTIVVFRKAF